MIKLEKLLYTAKAHTTGGRDGGASRTDDGRLQVTLSQPGTSGSGTNPEQLFAAGWSACFLSAIKLIAGKRKIALPAESSCRCRGRSWHDPWWGRPGGPAEREPPGHGPGNGPVPGGRCESRVPVLVSHKRQHRRQVQPDHIRTCGAGHRDTACLKLARSNSSPQSVRERSERVLHVYLIFTIALGGG